MAVNLTRIEWVYFLVIALFLASGRVGFQIKLEF